MHCFMILSRNRAQSKGSRSQRQCQNRLHSGFPRRQRNCQGPDAGGEVKNRLRVGFPKEPDEGLAWSCNQGAANLSFVCFGGQTVHNEVPKPGFYKPEVSWLALAVIWLKLQWTLQLSKGCWDVRIPDPLCFSFCSWCCGTNSEMLGPAWYKVQFDAHSTCKWFV